VFVVTARPWAARKGVKLKVGGGAVGEGERIEAAASSVALARRVDVAMLAFVLSRCAQILGMRMF
jgi:hypothetical protein